VNHEKVGVGPDFAVILVEIGGAGLDEGRLERSSPLVHGPKGTVEEMKTAGHKQVSFLSPAGMIAALVLLGP